MVDKARSQRASLVRNKGALQESAARKRGLALVALIQRRKSRVTEDFYDMGEALRELHDKKLHLALGYRSFAVLLGEEKLLGLSQAKKLIAVVTNVPREDALRLGQEKAYELVRYTAATPEADPPGWLLATKAKIGGKGVALLSAHELRAATTAVLEKKGGRRRVLDPAEKEAREGARAAHAWLRERGVGRAKVSAIRVKGEWRVRMEVPAKEIARVTKGR